MSLRGKVALVTGGAHRLGRAVVLELASRGVDVAINFHHSHEAALATERCAAGYGVNAMRSPADAADPDAVERMVEEISDRLGTIDYLIAAAGVFRRTPVEAVGEDDWHDMMHGNVATFRTCAAAVAPRMQESGGGAIVAFGDVAALRPWRDYIPYCVSKSLVLAHARALAVELAPTVRVNSVLPGPVLFPPDYPEAARQSEIRRTLLQRAGHPGDIAGAVAFLLESDYLTGAELPVDGGRLLA